MKTTLLISAAVLLAAPGIAAAQSSMSDMAMKDAPAPIPQGAAPQPAADHSGDDQSKSAVSEPAAADPHAGHAAEPKAASAPKVEAVDHSGHDMNAMAGMSEDGPVIGTAPAPAPPSDHAADAVFEPAEMARAREALRRENGAFSGSMVLFDLAEFQAREGRDGYRWAGEAWFGGDIDRLLIKTEGEGTFGKPSRGPGDSGALFARDLAILECPCRRAARYRPQSLADLCRCRRRRDRAVLVPSDRTDVSFGQGRPARAPRGKLRRADYPASDPTTKGGV